jgi:hypothetical protein
MRTPAEWYDVWMKDCQPPECVIFDIQQEAYKEGQVATMNLVKQICDKETKRLLKLAQQSKLQ